MKRISKFEQLLIILTIAVGLVTALILVRNQQLFIKKAEAPLCPYEGATCLWTGQPGISSYHVTITDVTTGNITKELDVASTSAKFTPILNHRFRCEVNAINTCGSGPKGKSETICSDVFTLATPSATTDIPLSVTQTATQAATISASLITPTPTLEPTVTRIPSPTMDLSTEPTNIPPEPSITQVPTPTSVRDTHSFFAGWNTPQTATTILSSFAFFLVIITIALAIIRKKSK